MTSPMGALSRRIRSARSNAALGATSVRQRLPDTLAGERRKTRCDGDTVPVESQRKARCQSLGPSYRALQFARLPTARKWRIVTRPPVTSDRSLMSFPGWQALTPIFEALPRPLPSPVATSPEAAEAPDRSHRSEYGRCPLYITRCDAELQRSVARAACLPSWGSIAAHAVPGFGLRPIAAAHSPTRGAWL